MCAFLSSHSPPFIQTFHTSHHHPHTRGTPIAALISAITPAARRRDESRSTHSQNTRAAPFPKPSTGRRKIAVSVPVSITVTRLNLFSDQKAEFLQFCLIYRRRPKQVCTSVSTDIVRVSSCCCLCVDTVYWRRMQCVNAPRRDPCATRWCRQGALCAVPH